MKKNRRFPSSDELMDEYNFRDGARGKYHARYAEGSNVVILEPDVARAFPTAVAVNQALREVLQRAGASDSPG